MYVCIGVVVCEKKTGKENTLQMVTFVFLAINNVKERKHMVSVLVGKKFQQNCRYNLQVWQCF